MPSIVQSDQDNSIGKKRRWDDASSECGRLGQLQQIQSKMNSSRSYTSHYDYIHPQPHQQPLTRVLQNIKRQRLDRAQSSPFPLTLSSRAHATSPGSNIGDPNGEPSPGPQPFLPIQDHHQTPSGAWSYQLKPQAQKKDLNPCHICHRRPTLLSELDQYTNCEGCSERTCWICVRECVGYNVSPHTVDGRRRASWKDRAGMDAQDIMIDNEDGHAGMNVCGRVEDESWDNGHRRTVCSRCCVEKGSDGEVWCLGCLRDESGGLD